MPKLYKLGQYSVFFWSDENGEAIHVHICIGSAMPNATKIWLTANGDCIVAHNRSKIPRSDLNEIIESIRTNHLLICSEWKKHFNVDIIKFYC